MTDIEVLKLEGTLKNLESKINYTYEIAMWTRNTLNEKAVTLLDLIFWDIKENKYIQTLCTEKFRKHERNIIFGCENKFSKYELNKHTVDEILAQFVDSSVSVNEFRDNAAEKKIIRYFFLAILGTTLIEDKQKYRQRIADIAVCLNINIEKIKDITNAVNYVLDNSNKFEFKNNICKETLGDIL